MSSWVDAFNVCARLTSQVRMESLEGKREGCTGGYPSIGLKTLGPKTSRLREERAKKNREVTIALIGRNYVFHPYSSPSLWW